GYDKDDIRYKSQSGELIVSRNGNQIVMDFPLWPFKKEEGYEERLEEAFGAKPIEVYSGYDWVAVFESKEFIASLSPNMSKIAEIKEARGFIATAKDGDQYDFVSRAFFPAIGIDEDPVTGSAHCILAPLWEQKLNKTTMKARQVSDRGGDLDLEIKNDRLFISGEAKLYLKGTIYV
ncbi:MAG: PhzF family phenazine biosynthesis protein, partial [Pseudomonadota bacterium]